MPLLQAVGAGSRQPWMSGESPTSIVHNQQATFYEFVDVGRSKNDRRDISPNLLTAFCGQKCPS